MNENKSENLQENIDYYLSPEGLMVFTEAYHLERGHCCESGCKHCPYGFICPQALNNLKLL